MDSAAKLQISILTIAGVLAAAYLLTVAFSLSGEESSTVSSAAPRWRAENDEGSPLSLLAFVLLNSRELPTPDAVSSALRSSGLPAASVSALKESHGFSIKYSKDNEVLAMSMGAPVPIDEITEAVRRNILIVRDKDRIAAHNNHMVVTGIGLHHESRLIALWRFTKIVAEIAHVSGAVGVYWGAGGVAQPSYFFRSVARSKRVPISLWIGVDVATKGTDRIRLLSRGMESLDLPDLLMTGSAKTKPRTVGRFFNTLRYMATRPEPLNEGESVEYIEDVFGRVRYVPSPADEDVRVVRIDLK